MRLDKFLAHLKIGSRKEVKKYIRNGYVRVNDEICKNDDFKIDPEHDEVYLDDQLLTYQSNYYIMLNKPQDYLCSSIDEYYPSVLNLIYEPIAFDLQIVGRLDVDTTGLLLLTDDGKFNHYLMSPKHKVNKTYEVTLEKPVTKEMVKILESEIPYEDGFYKPGEVEVCDEMHILLTISEGKFHQVKNMVKYSGNEVVQLKRIKIGDLSLDEQLDEGEYRMLSKEEIAMLYKEVE